MASQYYEPDGACADFFIISNQLDVRPNGKSVSQNSTKVAEMFEHIASKWPHWNRTAGANLTRHLVLSPCDHGPGDCMYNSLLYLPRRSARLPASVRPSNLQRKVGFLEPTGATGATAFFQPGIDIRLPQDEHHSCGPYCGVPRVGSLSTRRGRAMPVLREHSPWVRVDAAHRGALLRRRRPIQFFWSGWSSGVKGFRGSLFRHHCNRSGWLLRDTSPYGQATRRVCTDGLGQQVLDGARGGPTFLARSMSASDFCYSPLGQHHGDSDRYLPALLYACIPVFLKKDYGPFAEVIPWHEFSLHVAPEDLPNLHKRLANIPQEDVVRMRFAMSRWWPRMLWPWKEGGAQVALGVNGTTDIRTDAFVTFIEVLRRRLEEEERGCPSDPPP